MRVATDAIVVNKRKEVLVIQRKLDSNAFPGEWAFPGGAMEDDDPRVWSCCKRELQEETGILAHNYRFVNFFDTMMRDPRGRVISFAYLIIVEDPIVKPGDDAVAYKWIPFQDLMSWASVEARVKLAFDHNYIMGYAYYKYPELFRDE